GDSTSVNGVYRSPFARSSSKASLNNDRFQPGCRDCHAASEVLEAVFHVIPIQDPVEQHQHLNQRADQVQVLVCIAPGDPSVADAASSQDQIVGVMRYHDPFVGGGNGQLVRIGQAALAGFL